MEGGGCRWVMRGGRRGRGRGWRCSGTYLFSPQCLSVGQFCVHYIPAPEGSKPFLSQRLLLSHPGGRRPPLLPCHWSQTEGRAGGRETPPSLHPLQDLWGAEVATASVSRSRCADTAPPSSSQRWSTGLWGSEQSSKQKRKQRKKKKEKKLNQTN